VARAPVEERLEHALVKGIVDFIEADTEEARKLGEPARRDRRPADGRHERRRRPLRRGQDVPAAGRQERARDEAGGRATSSRSSRRRRRARRRHHAPTARSCWPRSRATCTTSARTSSASCSSATTTRSSTSASWCRRRRSSSGAREKNADIDRPLGPDHAVARRDGARRARDGAPGLQAAAADRRRDDEPAAHGGQDRAAVRAARGLRADASRSVGVVPELLSRGAPRRTPKSREDYEKRREQHAEAQGPPLVPIADARANAAPRLGAYAAPPAAFRPARVRRLSARGARRATSTGRRSSAWELAGKYPAILDDPGGRRGGAQPLRDAPHARSARRGAWLTAKARVGFGPRAAGDDIEVYADETREELARWPCCASRSQAPEGKPNECLADFVAPKDSGVRTTSARSRSPRASASSARREFEAAHDDYSLDPAEGARRSPRRGLRRVAAREGAARAGATRPTSSSRNRAS
jgi:hypothetical protein